MAPGEPDRPLRSRKGCWTCRKKKVKCDERQPRCRRCERLERECDFSPRPRKKHTKRSVLEVGGSRRGDTPTPEIASLGNVAASPEAWQTTPISTSLTRSLPAVGAHTPTGSEDAPSPALSISLHALSPECRAILRPTDGAALTCYLAVIAPAIDTKDLEYSVPMIVWELSRTRSMLLHMICALGSHQLGYQKEQELAQPSALSSAAGEHYGAGMRLLATTICEPADSESLDATLSALWLMIVYEQKFGDGCGDGLNAHLKGAASVIRARLRNLRTILNWDEHHGDLHQHGAAADDNEWRISPFAGRMIVWISFLDAAAAFHGVGGDFNRSLGEAMEGLAEDATLSRLRGFASIHRYSALMCRDVWKAAYPQEQLLEDLENRQLFYLYGQVGQLRYVLSQLTLPSSSSSLSGEETDDLVRRRRILEQSTGRALRHVGERFSELLEVAGHLDFPSASARHRKFITNIRFVVPFYHAVVLCYYRAANTSHNSSSGARRAAALQQIITLAYQSHRDGGEEAMARMGWPLFIAALETVDLVHKGWVLARFSHLQSRGENWRRAYKALQVARAEEGAQPVRTDYATLLAREDLDRFVI